MKKDVINKLDIYKIKTTKELLKYYQDWTCNNKYNKDMVDWNYTAPHETASVLKKYALSKNLKILDAGCGRGQNTKVLSEYFPTSIIKAFDLSEGALSVVELGVENQKQIQTEVGSITDINYLKQYPTNGFDHVLLSHVFSFIMSGSEAESIQLRQQIIDELIRISSRTVLILDAPGIFHLKEPSFNIEIILSPRLADEGLIHRI